MLTWFFVPLYKVFKYLTIDPELHRKRPRAIAFSSCVAAALVVVIGIIKFPVNVDAEGALKVANADDRPVYAEQPGFIRQIGKGADGHELRDGDFVRKGQVLLVLENKQLETQLAVLDAHVRQVRLEMMQATPVSANQREMKQMELEKTFEQRSLLAQQVEKLTVRAPIDGELIAPNFQNKVNQFVGRDNKEILRVENVQNQYIAAVLPQEDYQLLDEQAARLSSHTEARMVSDIDHTIKAQSVVLTTPALVDPPSMLLTQPGGGQGQLDQNERQAPKYAVPQFQAHVVLDDSGNYITGQRAYVRFKLEKKPLIWQWGRRFWQLIEQKGASAKWM